MTEYTGGLELDIHSTYAPNRNKSVENLIRKYVFEKLKTGSRVLEFGAGKGEFIYRFLNDKKYNMLAIDIDESYRKNLSESAETFANLNEIQGELDAIYLIDVLEHIEDDNAILEKFYSKLRKGGRVFIYVPARQELYSAFDKKIGHYRRYSLKQLMSQMKKTGFNVEVAKYHELLGYFASGISKLLGGKQQVKPAFVSMYDKVLVPVTNLIEKVIPIPFGKSIYLAAVKP